MVARICSGWSVQMYSKVPGVVNAWLKVPLGWRTPESNIGGAPWTGGAATVWMMSDELVQETVGGVLSGSGGGRDDRRDARSGGGQGGGGRPERAGGQARPGRKTQARGWPAPSWQLAHEVVCAGGGGWVRAGR